MAKYNDRLHLPETISNGFIHKLPNLKQDDENWKVRLIEEAFINRMWNGKGV